MSHSVTGSTGPERSGCFNFYDIDDEMEKIWHNHAQIQFCIKLNLLLRATGMTYRGAFILYIGGSRPVQKTVMFSSSRLFYLFIKAEHLYYLCTDF